jgi:hypothetical protein
MIPAYWLMLSYMKPGIDESVNRCTIIKHILATAKITNIDYVLG